MRIFGKKQAAEALPASEALPAGESLPADAPQLPSAPSLPDAPTQLGQTLAPPPSGPSAKPHSIRLQATAGELLAQVTQGETKVASLSLPMDASEISEEEIDKLNETFATLDDAELTTLLGDLDKRLGKLQHLAKEHFHDPLVPSKRIKKRAEEKHDDKASLAKHTEEKARKAVVVSEGVGHIAAPGALVAAAEVVTHASHAEIAHAAAHGLHIAAESLHVGAGVIDLYLAAKSAKHSPWHAVFHGVRGAMGFASLFVPALGIGVAVATVGKLAYDATEGVRARRGLQQANQRLTEHLTKIVNEALTPAAAQTT